MVQQILEVEEKRKISYEVLKDLPEWFGIPESLEEYVRVSLDLPFWADIEGDKVRGFIALMKTSPYTAEVYVMGVKKQYHRAGIGSKLFDAFYDYAKKNNYEYLQVKTVQKGKYKEYDLTNSFYQKLGFRELECFKTLWDEWNPCQIYVMSVK